MNLKFYAKYMMRYTKGIIALCVLIIIHHFYIHYNDDISTIDKFFQISDVNNHETVVIGLIGIAVGFYLKNKIERSL